MITCNEYIKDFMYQFQLKKRNSILLSLIFVVAFFSSCKQEVYVMDAPEIIPTKNVTVKKMRFTLSDSASVEIKLKNLKSEKEHWLNSISKSLSHDVLLAGLKPDQDYSIEILSAGKIFVAIDSFHTSPIEENIVSLYKRTNAENPFNGYLLTQRRLVRGSVYMVDSESDLVWYQMVDGQPKLSHWTENKEVLILVGDAKHKNSAGDRITSYSIDGEISYSIDLKKLGLVAHHEVLEHGDDVFTLVYDSIPNTVNGKEEVAISTALVRLSKSGDVLWKWSTFDIKKPDGIPLKDMEGDWGHANAFSFDDDGNVLISYRDWNQIWKVDVNSGDVLWILGADGNYRFNSTPFDSQHAIHKNRHGDYMLFDNGRDKRQSRIVSYNLDTDEAKPIISIELPDDLYADRMGNVNVLPNDNILLCSPRSRSIAVLKPTGEIVYHINTGIPDPYRATFVPSFYNQP